MSSERSEACPGRGQLESLAGGLLSDEEAAKLEEHLSECDSCCQRLEKINARFLSRIRPADCGEQVDSDHGERPEALLRVMGELRATIVLPEPTPIPPSADLIKLLGGTVGPYELREELGRGGMGVVLRGFDRDLERMVAVKVLAPDIAAVPRFREAFLSEARAAARLQHENVMPIYAVDQREELPYLVMPLVEGPNLQEHLDAVGALDVEAVTAIGCQLCRALEAAHGEGLVHGDVKPGNVMLLDLEDAESRRVWLTDFGLVRALGDPDSALAGERATAGTPGYMAPELLTGSAGDHRSDLFALGCVLYTMATGRTPDREPAPQIPDWMQALVASLLSEDPAGRPGSASAVRKLLEPHLPENRGLSRRAVMIGGGLLVAVVGVAAWAIRPAGPPPPAVADQPEGYLLEENGARLSTLAEAVAEAAPGATIWVRVNGEIELDPIDIPDGKSLTIRSAEGCEPIFVSRDWRDEMLRSTGPLCLMGLEFRHPFASIPSEASPLISCREGPIFLANCRFVRTTADPRTQQTARAARPLLRIDDCPQTGIRNCEFYTMVGTCLVLQQRTDSVLRIENSLMVGQHGLRLTSNESTRHRIDLIDNTLAGSFPISLRSRGQRFLKSEWTLNGNFFDFRNSLLELHWLGPADGVSDAITSTTWKAPHIHFHRTGRAKRGAHASMAIVTGPGGKRFREIATLDEFAALFGVAGREVQAGLDWAMIENYRKKFSLMNAELFVPEQPLSEAGIDLMLLGPGASLARWSATEDYERWRLRARELMTGAP